MYLSSLMGTMGGKLKLVAQFPDHELIIRQFESEEPSRR